MLVDVSVQLFLNGALCTGDGYTVKVPLHAVEASPVKWAVRMIQSKKFGDTQVIELTLQEEITLQEMHQDFELQQNCHEQ